MRAAWEHWRRERAEGEPLVTVLVPARNAACWIGDALSSVRAQTYERVETLVIDDGSEDETASVAQAFADVHVVRIDRSGVSRARNVGIGEARGSLLHFLDADDVLRPTCLERKVELLLRAPERTIAVSDVVTTGGDEERRRHESVAPLGEPPSPLDDVLIAMSDRYAFHTSSLTVPRAFALEIGGFDESLPLSDDTRFFFHLGMADAGATAPREALTERRLVPDSLTSDRERKLRYIAICHFHLIADALSDPSAWPAIGALTLRMAGDRFRRALEAGDDAMRRAWDRVVRATLALPETGRLAGLSARPLIRLLRRRLRRAWERTDLPPGASPASAERWSAALEEARRRTERAGPADLRFWTEHPRARLAYPSLRPLVRRLERDRERGRIT